VVAVATVGADADDGAPRSEGPSEHAELTNAPIRQARHQATDRPYRARILRPVRTRTLLLLAVACGLVILAAGVVQLLRIAGQDEPSPAARVGEEVQIGDLAVTVEDFVEDDRRAVVDLELGGVDDPDGTEEFRLVVPGESLRAIDDECAGATVAPRACSLTFDLGDTEGSSRVLIYRRGDEQARWELSDGS
jgi:hypothetical protein